MVDSHFDGRKYKYLVRKIILRQIVHIFSENEVLMIMVFDQDDFQKFILYPKTEELHVQLVVGLEV